MIEVSLFDCLPFVEQCAVLQGGDKGKNKGTKREAALTYEVGAEAK